MSFKNASFHIAKQSDAQVLRAGLDAFAEAGVGISKITLTLDIGGEPINVNPPDFQDENLSAILALNSERVHNLRFHFGSNLSLLVTRDEGALRDHVTIELGALNNHPRGGPNQLTLSNLSSAARKHLKEFDPRSSVAAILGPELQRHFDLKTHELEKLQSFSEGLLADIAKHTVEVRKQLDEEYASKRNELEKEAADYKKELHENYESKNTFLEQREAALKSRLEEVNDRESRHERRQIRNDLKKELEKRNERFRLTEGTQKLRTPVFVCAGILTTVLALVFLYITKSSADALGSQTALPVAQLVLLSIKQLVITIAFLSSAAFLIKWTNDWFQQHADEEFRMKRFELDLDRASWVVEMALEWKEEKGTEIPKELLERLTVNLFSEDTDNKTSPTRTEQLATALLDASAKASVDLGPAKLEFDKKGVKKLANEK